MLSMTYDFYDYILVDESSSVLMQRETQEPGTVDNTFNANSVPIIPHRTILPKRSPRPVLRSKLTKSGFT